MTNFDFRAYHVRSINAHDEAERAALNQELKDLYASLSEAERVVFNEQLQVFLVKQYKSLHSDYQAIKESGTLDQP
jgi:hypothetical protein